MDGISSATIESSRRGGRHNEILEPDWPHLRSTDCKRCERRRHARDVECHRDRRHGSRSTLVVGVLAEAGEPAGQKSAIAIPQSIRTEHEAA